MKKAKLTQKRLKEVLDYNPETGVFVWKERCLSDFKSNKYSIRSMNSWNTRYSDNYVGSLRDDGYLIININKIPYLGHRLAWLYMYGYFPENDLDHIDRDPANNRLCNLREVSKQCNMRNCSIYKNNKSGVIGVCWKVEVGKWAAQIGINSKRKPLGTYINFQDAVKARWEAEVKYDFPSCNSTSTAYLYLKEHNLL